MLLIEHWLNPKERTPTKFDQWVLPRVMPVGDGMTVLHRTAERIVFAECIPSVLHEMTINKQIDINAISQEFKMPTQLLWIEWAVPHAEMPDIKWLRAGACVQLEPSGVLGVVLGAGFMRNDGVCKAEMFAGCTFPAGTIRSGDAMKLEIVKSAEGMLTRKDVMHCLSELVFSLFLLGHPKVIESTPAIESPARAKARRKQGIAPFVEYRKVILRPGVITRKTRGNSRMSLPEPVDTQSDAAVKHRKYHRVLGHFRHYNPEKKEPYSTWVDEYYRGDPKLGVIIKTKEMRPSSAK